MKLRPEIKTPLPGSRAREVLALDEEFISPSYTRSYDAVIARGEGVWVWDVDGNKFLDMNAGIAVCSTGHRHPKVVEAVRGQLDDLIHMSGTDFYYPLQVELARELSRVAPGDTPRKSFLTNSGTESNECALKLVRYKTRRQYVVTFDGAFHGRTYGSMSLSSSKAVHRAHFGPLLPGVVRAPYPDPYRPPLGATSETVSDAVVGYIESELFRRVVDPEEVAAFFFEPVQGEGGYVFPPDDFFGKLKALADRHGILLVDDEIQAGMGRTGRLSAVEWSGVAPQVVTYAKGIASGMPLGACVADGEVMDWPSGAHANTFGGNPVSCAAALATLSLLEGSLMENARDVGERALGDLRALQSRHEFVGDVRGRGLMLAVDFVRDRRTREPWPEKRNAVVEKCFRLGALFLGAGPSALRIVPPLVVSHEEMALGVEILADAIAASG